MLLFSFFGGNKKNSAKKGGLSLFMSFFSVIEISELPLQAKSEFIMYNLSNTNELFPVLNAFCCEICNVRLIIFICVASKCFMFSDYGTFTDLSKCHMMLRSTYYMTLIFFNWKFIIPRMNLRISLFSQIILSYID